jgi:ADP-ribose pyrophosphatase
MTTQLLQTKVFNVVSEARTLPDGRTIDKTYIQHPGGVVLLPFLDDKNIVMIRNYRLTLDKWLWELPAGTLEPPESPMTCAERELREETGYEAECVEPLIEFYTAPGFCNELLRVFTAKGLRFVGQHLMPDEYMAVEKVALADVFSRVARGEINDAKTIAALCAWSCRQGKV